MLTYVVLAAPGNGNISLLVSVIGASVLCLVAIGYTIWQRKSRHGR